MTLGVTRINDDDVNDDDDDNDDGDCDDDDDDDDNDDQWSISWNNTITTADQHFILVYSFTDSRIYKQ